MGQVRMRDDWVYGLWLGFVWFLYSSMAFGRFDEVDGFALHFCSVSFFSPKTCRGDIIADAFLFGCMYFCY